MRNFAEQMETAVAKFQPQDVGAPQWRRRTEIDTDQISFTLILIDTDIADLSTFYETTLASGTQAFTMTHPRTFATQTFTFTAAPDYHDLGDNMYEVSIKLRKMP